MGLEWDWSRIATEYLTRDSPPDRLHDDRLDSDLVRQPHKGVLVQGGLLNHGPKRHRPAAGLSCNKAAQRNAGYTSAMETAG